MCLEAQDSTSALHSGHFEQQNYQQKGTEFQKKCGPG